MPHRSVWSSSASDHRHSGNARARPAPPGPVRRVTDYALVHAGRQLRLGPIAFWIVVGTLVIMAVWTVTTATYFAFRDDVLTRLIGRQAEIQFAYEDRIAELRAQVDRLSSRQLLDQEQFEQKLDQMVRRQATLESRTTTLNALPDPAVTSSIKRATPIKPSPINDIAIPANPRDRKAALGVNGVLDRLQASLDRVEARQAAALTSIEESFGAKARFIRSVLGELGVDAGKVASTGDAAATGGPFIPARLRADAGPFERQVHRVSIARVEVERLTHTLGNMPLRRPVSGQVDPSSGFGVRIDPFLQTPAMHTGLDILGQPGDPVRATANGKVAIAGWQGGYGKMIEIDHGNGLATRYGHLSAIEVVVGQSVKVGQVIGQVGTTGRSTGPHLHYETRIGGEAVDPQKFLRAGTRLGTAG